jgi:hypothetical protein
LNGKKVFFPIQKSERIFLFVKRAVKAYLFEEEEEEYPCLSATFRYGLLSGDSFESPIFFPTTITSCSSGQKAGLTQISSA